MLIGEIRPIPLAKFKQLRVGEDERVLETAGGGSAILLRDLIGKAPAGADLLIRRLRQKLRRGHVGREPLLDARVAGRSEEHTSELQSLMRISYAVFCLK